MTTFLTPSIHVPVRPGTGEDWISLAPATGPAVPSWLRLVRTVHCAGARAEAAAADLLVLLAAAWATSGAGHLALGMALGALVTFWFAGVYRNRDSTETQGILWYIGRVVGPLAITSLVAATIAHRGGVPIRFALLSLGGLTALRTATWMVLVHERRRWRGLAATAILGDRDVADLVTRKLLDFPEAGLQPLVHLDLTDAFELGATNRLRDLLESSGVEHVVLVPHGGQEDMLGEVIEGCHDLPIRLSMVPPLSDLFLNPASMTQVGGVPLIPLGLMSRPRPSLPGKRLLDAVGSLALLVVFGPVIVAAALAVKFTSPGPVIYRQRRVGRDGREFWMLKFRSMVPGAEHMIVDLRDQNAADGLLFKVVDDPRVTPIGRIIRKFAVDELPQLVNVLRGDMSLVGPRPLPVNPEEFTAVDARRHDVPPGITGFWQVAGRHDLTYREMINLDLAYIRNWSLWLDIQLLLRTIPALIRRRGIA